MLKVSRSCDILKPNHHNRFANPLIYLYTPLGPNHIRLIREGALQPSDFPNGQPKPII